MSKFYPNPNLRIICDTGKDKGYIINSKTNDLMELNLDGISLLTHNINLLNGNKEQYDSFINFSLDKNLITTDEHQNIIPVNYIGHNYHLKKIQYEITSVCNLKCLHCFCEELNSGRESDLPLSSIFGLIDQAEQMGVIDFYITGGEPLIRKDIFDVLAYLKQKRIRSGLFTNGTYITEEVVNKLKENNVSYIQLSLDAHNAEIHDSFRQAEGSFDKTVNAIKLLQSANIALSVTVIISRHNVAYLKEIVAFLRDDLKVDYGFDRLISYGNALKNKEISISPEQVAKKVKELLPEEQQISTLCMENYKFDNKEYIPPYCGVGYDFLYINFKGDVWPCPTITPENYKFKFYNLSNENLQDIWADKSQDGISKFRNIQCKIINTCPVAETCLGGCRSNALIEGDRIDDVDKYMCHLLKS